MKLLKRRKNWAYEEKYPFSYNTWFYRITVKLEFGSPIQPLIKEAEILHYIDLIDAKIFAMDDAIEKSSKDNDFTEQIRALDNRKIYKPKL